MSIGARPTADLPKSLTDHAVTVIRGMILSGELSEGERLIEQQLTDLLGISRPPLREAMRILEAEGFIVTEARRGSRVVSLTEQDVFEVLTLRAALERLAVEIGIPVRDGSRLQTLRDAQARMEAAAAAADRSGLVEAGYAFHAALVALAGHTRLNEAYESVHMQVMLCMARNLISRDIDEDLDNSARKHRILVEAVERGDPRAVLAELEKHGQRASIREPK